MRTRVTAARIKQMAQLHLDGQHGTGLSEFPFPLGVRFPHDRQDIHWPIMDQNQNQPEISNDTQMTSPPKRKHARIAPDLPME